jgi:VCBS repeat-containing protein
MREAANSDEFGFGQAGFIEAPAGNTANLPVDAVIADDAPGGGLAAVNSATGPGLDGGSSGAISSGAAGDGGDWTFSLPHDDSFRFDADQNGANDQFIGDSSTVVESEWVASLPGASISQASDVTFAWTYSNPNQVNSPIGNPANSSGTLEGHAGLGDIGGGGPPPADIAGSGSFFSNTSYSAPSSPPSDAPVLAWLANPAAGSSGASITNASIGDDGATAAQVQQALDESGLSVNGSGIRVGVLSDSFNDLGGAAADEANGALPPAAEIDVIKDLASGGTDEGRAMMQIIHDIAPGASLAFYTAFDSEQDFANGILALAAAGCKVIVDDVSYFDEPFFQNGVVAQAIQTVEAEGVTYVTAAGNDASDAYQAAWAPISGTFDGTKLTDAESFGGSLVQTVTINTEGTGYDVPVLLEWNQAYGAATSDLEMLVFNSSGRLVAKATNASSGEPTNPWLGVDLTQTGTYYIAIENLSGPNPGLIKEITEGDGLPVTISGADAGSVYGHAMTPGAITAGAVSTAETSAFGVNPPLSESFSSSGAGTELLFANNGTALSSPDTLSPVAVSGVDDIETTVPDLSDFYGTSAAAASLAGVAALILSANPDLTPAAVEQLMEETAIPIADPAVSGAGLAQVDPAVADATSQPTAASTPVVTIQLADDTGGDDFTSNDALIGTADPNAVVKLTLGTKTLGTTAANASGVWSFTPTGLANGQYTIVASETNSAGKTGTASLTFTLDTTVPVVTVETVSSTGISGGAGTLTAGETAVLTLVMSEAVTVSGGLPALALNNAGTATYDAVHSTSTSLIFDYTVIAGQYTTALAVTGINLHGATVTDIAGNIANFAAADTTFSHLLVDATTPVAVAKEAHDTLSGSVSVSHAQAATGGVLAKDSDSDPSDVLSVSAVNGSAANVGHVMTGAFGTLDLNSDGSYTYTNTNSSAVTAAGGVTEDTFNYTVSNGHGGTANSTLTVLITSPGETYLSGASGSTIKGGTGSYVLDGSAGNMNATAGSGTQWLVGGPGDTLNAGPSADTFIFSPGFGKETINNFNTAQDIIDLPQSEFANFAAVAADLHTSGANAVLTLDANDAITLSHIAVASLHAQNFHFIA